jgi:HK97 gp10 family phage protein
VSFSVEVNGITAVVESLAQMERRANANVAKAVEVTSRHVKDDAKKNAKEILGSSVRHQASTYQYEMKHPSRGIVEGWIGPVKGWKQAAIPLEYGTPYTAPKPALEPALTGNIPDLVKGMNMAIEDAL